MSDELSRTPIALTRRRALQLIGGGIVLSCSAEDPRGAGLVDGQPAGPGLADGVPAAGAADAATTEEAVAAINGRLTVGGAVGAEAFLDGAKEWPICGMHIAFNAFMPRSDADAVYTADRLAMLGVNTLRVMHFDRPAQDDGGEPRFVYDGTKGARCSWWAIAGAFPDGDPSKAISAAALARTNFFLARLKERGIRVFLAMDRWDVMFRGRSRPAGVSTPGYAFQGQWWQEPLLQDSKDYLTWLFSLHNPHTALRWGDDPVIAGYMLFNEQSMQKAYGNGNAIGTAGIDSLLHPDADPRWIAGWDADWRAWYRQRFTEAPTAFPTYRFDRESATGRPTWARLRSIAGDDGATERSRVALYLIEKQRWVNEQLRAHLRAIAPGILVAGCTNDFGTWATETGMDFQDAHSYLNRPTTAPNHQSPQSVPLVSARLSGGVLTCVLAAQGSGNEPENGKFVRLASLGFTTTDPNRDLVMTRASATSFTASLPGPDETFTVGPSSRATLAGETATLKTGPSPDDGTPHGASSIGHRNGFDYFTKGEGQHLAGKPLLWGETGSNGMSEYDFQQILVTATIALLRGQAGVVNFEYASTAFLDASITRFTGDLSGLLHHGRQHAQELMGHMLRHKVLPTTPSVTVQRVTDQRLAKISGGSAGGFSYALGWWPRLNATRWQGGFNDEGVRLRLKIDGVDDPSTLGTATAPFTFGLAPAMVRWDQAANRLEYTDGTATAKIAGVVGDLVDGVYGRLRIAGLPTGSRGAIVWVSADGKPLGSGRSRLFVLGPTANADFSWADAPTNSQYLSYGQGPARMHVHAASLTLDVGGRAHHVIGRAVDRSPTTLADTASGAKVVLETGAYASYDLEAI